MIKHWLENMEIVNVLILSWMTLRNTYEQVIDVAGETDNNQDEVVANYHSYHLNKRPQSTAFIKDV